MPIPSNPDFLESVIGTSADVLPIPAQDYADPTQNGALNYATGWPAITALPLEAGGKAPRREYFNALIQLMSSHIFFQQSGSLYPWSATLNYLSGAHVLGRDGKEYIAQKSNGPDVPDSSSVDPVGDESGTWLPAGSVYAPLATNSTPGILRPDGTTCTVEDGVLSVQAPAAEYMEAWRKSWIGVPRPWRSTTLPANHCWANGDLIAFAKWPELKQVYNSNGFAGMLMAWNANAQTQAANLGKWRPNAASPTGLYTPDLVNQFQRSWGPGATQGAGVWHRDEIRNISGWMHATGLKEANVYYATHYAGGGPFSTVGLPANQSAATPKYETDMNIGMPHINFDASLVVPTGTQNVPQHVWQPVIIYLGNPA